MKNNHLGKKLFQHHNATERQDEKYPLREIQPFMYYFMLKMFMNFPALPGSL
jgi:hypothetical protein